MGIQSNYMNTTCRVRSRFLADIVLWALADHIAFVAELNHEILEMVQIVLQRSDILLSEIVVYGELPDVVGTQLSGVRIPNDAHAVLVARNKQLRMRYVEARLVVNIQAIGPRERPPII